MTDTVTAKLAEWEALAQAATEGPWWPSHDTPSAHRPPDTYDVFDAGMGDLAVNLLHGDAAFIAVSRTAMPALLKFAQKVLKDHEPLHFTIETPHETWGGGTICRDDRAPWPCPIVQAAYEHLGDRP